MKSESFKNIFWRELLRGCVKAIGNSNSNEKVSNADQKQHKINCSSHCNWQLWFWNWCHSTTLHVVEPLEIAFSRKWVCMVEMFEGSGVQYSLANIWCVQFLWLSWVRGKERYYSGLKELRKRIKWFGPHHLLLGQILKLPWEGKGTLGRYQRTYNQGLNALHWGLRGKKKTVRDHLYKEETYFQHNF